MSLPLVYLPLFAYLPDETAGKPCEPNLRIENVAICLLHTAGPLLLGLSPDPPRGRRAKKAMVCSWENKGKGYRP